MQELCLQKKKDFLVTEAVSGGEKEVHKILNKLEDGLEKLDKSNK
ncbi:hypothetical protein [Fusobacterium ulcerans]|nr:hypothetical protein [Fusobacterium ulcerans]